MFERDSGEPLGGSAPGAGRQSAPGDRTRLNDSVEAVLRAAMCATPSSDSLASLLVLEPEALTSEDAVLFLTALEHHLGWLHAVQARALVAAAGPEEVTLEVLIPNSAHQEPDPGIDDILREEVASATRWGSGHAQQRIDVARVLTGYLPQVLAALESGLITYGHATAIATATRQLPGFEDPELRDVFAAACAQLQDRVLKGALSSNVTRTRRAASRAAAEIADLDPPHRRRYQKLAQFVDLVDDPDGLCTLTARMPAYQGHACMAAIRNLANDPRLDLPCDASIGQRRVLALATLIIGPRPFAGSGVGESSVRGHTVCVPSGGAQSGDVPFGGPGVVQPGSSQGVAEVVEASNADGPIAPRPKVHLDIVISLDALLGLTNQPGSISGAGHVPADVVRGLLADATMRRMVTDPLTGHLLDLGRRTYRIPDALRRFIEARDQTCRFPGCGRRATKCEIDHATAWSRNGTTDPGNLGALCTRHHRMKTHAGWAISDSDPSGACTWTSPFGHVYAHHPPPPLPPIPRAGASPPPTPSASPPTPLTSSPPDGAAHTSSTDSTPSAVAPDEPLPF